MIAVYAQSTVHEGIDVAMNGISVREDDAEFAAIRRRSVALNLRGRPIQLDGATVCCGLGVTRLQFEPADATDTSPVVVVVTDRKMCGSRASVVDTIHASAAAINQQVNRSDLALALAVASEALSARKSQVLVTIGIGAATVAVIALVVGLSISANRA